MLIRYIALFSFLLAGVANAEENDRCLHVVQLETSWEWTDNFELKKRIRHMRVLGEGCTEDIDRYECFAYRSSSGKRITIKKSYPDCHYIYAARIDGSCRFDGHDKYRGGYSPNISPVMKASTIDFYPPGFPDSDRNKDISTDNAILQIWNALKALQGGYSMILIDAEFYAFKACQ